MRSLCCGISAGAIAPAGGLTRQFWGSTRFATESSPGPRCSTSIRSRLPNSWRHPAGRWHSTSAGIDTGPQQRPDIETTVMTSASGRIEFVMLAVTPIAGRGGEGDRREPRPARSGCHRVLDPHFGQAPGLGCGPPDDGDCGRGQPGALGVDIAYLDPDHHRVPGRAGRVPRDLEQARAEEEHHPGIVWRAELPVDGQAQYVAVEAAAAVQIAGPQQDPAAQNVHAAISAAR
jgi:hypothetical protein